MARKSSPTISQEELYPSVDESLRPELDDARLVDLEAEEESPFLRGQKRVPARRGPLPKKTAKKLTWVVGSLLLLGLVTLVAGTVYQYGEHSWRFRVASSDDIQISGNHNVTHTQILEVFGADIGRNIFFIPLSQRKAQLEQIPWVEAASVMRFVPNQIKVEIHERSPVAFARTGSRICLVDAGGTLMELPLAGRRKYSFPVLVGVNANEPASTRIARMKIYNELVRELDSSGGHYSQDLSEVDVSDPDDVRVVANDPQGAVLIHLGSSNFLDRYKIYVSHVREWRQQFEKLESVDLRYDRQIIVNPDLRVASKEAGLSPAAARLAAAAGVKPAALVTRMAPPSARPRTLAIAPLKPLIKPSTKKVVRVHKKRGWKTAVKPNPAPAAVTARNSVTVSTPGSQPAPSSIVKSTHDGAKTVGKPSPAIAKEQPSQ